MAGRLNRVRSSMGSLCRHSATRKTVNRTAAPTSRPTIRVLDHPSSFPRIRANTSMNRALENEMNPIQSTRRWLVILGLLDLGQGDGDGQHPDGHVDEEDPPPPDPTGDGPADQRADGHRTAEHGTVDPEGRAPLLAGEGRGDQGQGGGEHDGPAHPLGGAGQVEHQRRGGQPAGQRGHREDPEADGEHLATTEHVPDHPGGQEEGGQGEGVGVDHPLDVAERRVQRLLDVGQGHVDHGDVQEEHEGGGADGDQGPPLAIEHWHGA